MQYSVSAAVYTHRGCVCVAIIQIVTDKTKKVIQNISTFMPNFSSYILYLLLLTMCYFTFGFTLDIKISTFYLTFTLLSLTSYVLYLLLLTIPQIAFDFTLDIK